MKRIIRTAGTTLAATALALSATGAALAVEQATVVMANSSIEAAPAALCSGYEVGLPDGCWDDDEATVVAAGAVSSVDTLIIPGNVR